MNRGVLSLLALFFFIGAVWVWNNSHLVAPYIQNGELLTLEARYTPEQIVEAHQREILGTGNTRELRQANLRFQPYLLMEVKYPQPDKSTREGVLLWSLVDGEMVLNTDTWEKTHGFEDAINANATPQDFKIMHALARNNGAMTQDQLQNALGLESHVIRPLIERAREKHLIIKRGNVIQLHFQNPRILVTPQTKMNEWIVTKPYSDTSRIPAAYSRKQVEKAAHAAFGSDFSVRMVKEIYLPVYSIETINPDGSVLTSFWNALNGRRIKRNSL